MISRFIPALIFLLGLSFSVKGFDIKETINNAADAAANNINKFVDGVEAVTCAVTHAGEFKKCNDNFQNWSNKKEVGESETKEYCCAYIRYRDCVEDVAKQYCGDKAAATVDAYMNAIKNNIMSEECQSYNSWWDCMDNTLFIIVIVAICLIAVGIVLGVFCCVKRCLC